MDIEQRLKRIEEKLGIVDEPAKEWEPGEKLYKFVYPLRDWVHVGASMGDWARAEKVWLEEQRQRSEAISHLRGMVRVSSGYGTGIDPIASVRVSAKKFLETIK